MIILGMMQVTKKIPFEDENVLNLVRAIYIGSNVIIAALYFYIQIQINKKKGASDSSVVFESMLRKSMDFQIAAFFVLFHPLTCVSLSRHDHPQVR